MIGYLPVLTKLTNHHRFLLLVIAGFSIDSVLINVLHGQGFLLNAAHSLSFIIALGIVAILVRLVLFNNAQKISTIWQECCGWVIIAFLVLFLRGGLLSTAIDVAGFTPKLSFFFCTITSWLLLYVAALYRLSQPIITGFTDAVSQHNFLIGIIAYSIILRFFYLGAAELFYEEAYYWNYAKHLDIGYLDHPPLTAWLIGLTTAWLGDNEFAVRFSAWLCWFVTAGFIYKLTDKIHQGLGYALHSLVLLAVLPIFFMTGWIMTPDAPLIACWVALVYFLYQAIIEQKRKSWYLAGIALGLGMLAKYTIALAIGAAFFFVITDRNLRTWLLRPEPYLMALIATILFLPVIIWNANHDWASFLYQTQNRIAEQSEFYLLDFIVMVALILTPSGFLSVLCVLWWRNNLQINKQPASARSEVLIDKVAHNSIKTGRNFLLMTTMMPVAFLGLVSIFKETKFHWTGPIWLGILPYMALLLIPGIAIRKPRLWRWVQRSWQPTLLICLLAYGAFFHYIAIGWAGIPYRASTPLLGWSNFGAQIKELVDGFTESTGKNLLVVGMDRNRISSGLAFYWNKALQSSATQHDPAWQYTSSGHLFKRRGLMYEYWFPPAEQEGKNLLLISANPLDLADRTVLDRVQSAQDIKPIVIKKNNQAVRKYYYRFVQGYQHGNNSATNSPVPKPVISAQAQ